MEKKFYTWKELEKDTKTLATILWNSYTKILAVSRGGLIPAYYLARQLWIKEIKTICLYSYTDGVKGNIQTIWEVEKINDPENWIIIDDVLDTGETMEYLDKLYPDIKKVVLLLKNRSVPNWSLEFANISNEWIVFPWEI